MGYREDAKINRYALDEEWEKQPILYLDWGEKAIEADIVKEDFKDALEVLDANISKQVRADPGVFGLNGRVTDKAISEIVVTHPDYRALKKQYLGVLKNAKILTLAEKGIDRKNKSLDRLTELYIRGYWGKDNFIDPTVESFLSRNQEEKQLKILNNNPRLRK